MTDPYYQHLIETKKRWDASSFLLQNQINDLREIERAVNGRWKVTLQDHIRFLAQFNNEAFDFIDASMRYHLLQRLTNITLEETVRSYAKQSPDHFIATIKKLKKCQK